MTFPKNICSRCNLSVPAGGKTPVGTRATIIIRPILSAGIGLENKHRTEPGVIFFLIFSAVLLLFSCSHTGSNAGTEEAADELIIYAASNLQPAMDELMQAFTKSLGGQTKASLNWEIRYGSSTYLMQQILMGARADLYLSANMNLPKELHLRGYGIEEPFAYTRGILCLVTTTTSDTPSANNAAAQQRVDDLGEYLELLQNYRLYYANPKLAPYGAAALHLLEQNGVVQNNVIMGENVGQTAQFLIQGGGVGFIPLSLAMEYQGKGMLSILRIFKSEAVTPNMQLLQGALILQEGMAQQFAQWLLLEGQEILERKGYDTLARGLEDL